MKQAMYCITVLTALALSGVAYAQKPLDIKKLCGNHDIVTNPKNKVFHGEFKRRGETLQTALVATPMKIGKSKTRIVFYLWGVQPKWEIDEAGCVPAVATWKTQTELRVSTTWRRKAVKYTFTEDATEGKVVYYGNRGSTTGKVYRSEQ